MNYKRIMIGLIFIVLACYLVFVIINRTEPSDRFKLDPDFISRLTNFFEEEEISQDKITGCLPENALHLKDMMRLPFKVETPYIARLSPKKDLLAYIKRYDETKTIVTVHSNTG